MAKKHLDRTRPYGEVCGLIGAKYEQDGIMFSAAGEALAYGDQVTDAASGQDVNSVAEAVPPVLPALPVEVEPVIPPAIPEFGSPAEAVAPPVSEFPAAPADPESNVVLLDQLTDDELRTHLASFGEAFVNRTEAIAFLNGKL